MRYFIANIQLLQQYTLPSANPKQPHLPPVYPNTHGMQRLISGINVTKSNATNIIT